MVIWGYWGKSWGIMSGIGRVLALVLCLSAWGAGVRAEEAVPVSGAFVTLEKAKGGTLKYSGTKADGSFTIKSLSEGRYRMSITPPRRDRNTEFVMAVRGTFEGIIVIPGGNVVKAKGMEPDRATGKGRKRRKPGSTILIPASIWREKAFWLDVEIVLEDIGGRFDYVLSDTEEISVLVLAPMDEGAAAE